MKIFLLLCDGSFEYPLQMLCLKIGQLIPSLSLCLSLSLSLSIGVAPITHVCNEKIHIQGRSPDVVISIP